MSTVAQLIRSNLHRPIRRCYIKRKSSVDASYESNWVRIDNWENQDRVINWGSISLEINHQPGQISTFEASSINMTFDNSEGHFSVETNPNSIWNEYLNRRYSKLKVEAGYYDDDDSEVGVENCFEGLIDRVRIDEAQTAKVSVLSYQTVLQKFDIKDLGFTSSSQTVEALLASILNQSKITQFMSYNTPAPGIAGVYIDDPSALEGTYWDVIKYFAQITNSIPLLNADELTFKSRTPTVSSVWDFKGFGSDEQPDIFKITSYDDEGADRVRLRFQEQNGSTVAVSVDEILLLKYIGNSIAGGEVQFVDLSNVKSTSKQDVLDDMVDYWEHPRPVIEFDTRFLLSQVKPADRITIEVKQDYQPKTGVFIVGISKLGYLPTGDSHVLAKAIGGFFILQSVGWMVTRILKDFNNWKCKIKAEKAVA